MPQHHYKGNSFSEAALVAEKSLLVVRSLPGQYDHAAAKRRMQKTMHELLAGSGSKLWSE